MDRITDCPDMTSAVDRGRKALTQQQQQQQTSVMDKGPREKIQKVYKQELWFLHSACCIMMIDNLNEVSQRYLERFSNYKVDTIFLHIR